MRLGDRSVQVLVVEFCYTVSSPASVPVPGTKGPLSLSAVPRLGNAALQTFTAVAGALLQLGLEANLSTFC